MYMFGKRVEGVEKMYGVASGMFWKGFLTVEGGWITQLFNTGLHKLNTVKLPRIPVHGLG